MSLLMAVTVLLTLTKRDSGFPGKPLSLFVAGPITNDLPDVQRKNNLRLLNDMKRRYMGCS